MLNKLKIGTKLYLGFGILILMLSSIVLTGWFGVGQVNYGLKVVQYFGAVSDNGNQSIINCEQAKTASALHIYAKDSKASATVTERIAVVTESRSAKSAETTQMIGNNNTQIQAGADVASQTADTLVAIVEQAMSSQNLKFMIPNTVENCVLAGGGKDRKNVNT